MSEPMAPATALQPPHAAAPHEQTPLTVRDLFEAGVHFGHQTRRWNPRMKPFLFGERNGVHIVDLDQTLPRLEGALEFLRRTVTAGGKVLFVGTKRQAQAPIQDEAQRAGQFYVNRRWLGGMLTNFKTVRKSIERFKELLEQVGDEQRASELSKKDLSRVNRWIEKYRKSLDGIKEMTRLPDALFVIDVGCEAIAIKEANRLGIPIVGVVDSNCDPDSIDYVVPGNDDSLRAIQLYCARVADACIEGSMLYNERVQAEVAEEERARAAGPAPERAATGKVVVEITQQPRRGRGTHSAGGPGGRGKPREEAAEPEPASEAPAAGE
ncbi:MAG TPA: 30S ribosomal protein S2 [Myxococcota bacterium]|nr:30S ribosomal protein S2 [Myxococcota bacterium]